MTLLAERAHKIETWAEEHFIDPDGVVYSQLDQKTGAPARDDFFEEEARLSMHVPDVDLADFWAYENCGMTTGAYLQAMVCRYEATQEPLALERARRSVRGIGHIYEIGKQLEEGFFPKIYGGRFSKQTSTDQVLYAVLALDRYVPHADAVERASITRMITRMIGFWVKREYRFGYYHIPDMVWPLARFPSLLRLAYAHSGETRFLAEYQRLLAAGVNRYPGESRLRRKRSGEIAPSAYEKEQRAWLAGSLADAVTMDIMELDYLLRTDPGNTWAGCWKASMRAMWEEGRAAIGPDGRHFINILVDMATGVPRRPDAVCSDQAMVTGASSGWGSMIARAGVQAVPHLAEERPTILSVAQRVLKAQYIKDLTYMNDPERWPPEHRYKTRFFSGDAMANWLWAYWQGALAGYWPDEWT